MPAAAITQANWLIRRATDDVISMAGSLSGCRWPSSDRPHFDGRKSAAFGRPAVARNRVALRRSGLSSTRRTSGRPPQQYRRDVSRRNWAFDIALAAVVGVLGQLEVWLGIGSTHRQGPLWAQSLLYAVTALLLVGRRVRPLACLTAMVVVSIVEFVAVGSPEGFGVSVALLIATYTVGNRLEWGRSWIALVLSVVVWVTWAAFDPMNTTFAEAVSSLVWLTPSIIAWLLGALVRVSRLNAEQRRVNREQRASQAVAEERNRIARELHDVIGHSVSVMTVQASAVRRRLTPEQAVERQALETVETVGREALAEMRRMVGVLRQSGEGICARADAGARPGGPFGGEVPYGGAARCALGDRGGA